MKTIAIMNLKGGVGKTVTAINLTDALRRGGRRSVLVDCDGQMSLTRFYFPDLDPDNTATVADVLEGQTEPVWSDSTIPWTPVALYSCCRHPAPCTGWTCGR